jgi:voltage-gated potassium channel Kch
VYLFIGLIFASLFSGTDGFTNTPSFSGDHPTDYGYASFVTLTTVGFGDVVPLTPFVRRLVVVEAIIGQMFLATTVARVVSLYDGSGRRARQRRDSDAEPGD